MICSLTFASAQTHSFGITKADESQEPRKSESLVTLGFGTGYIGLTIYAGLTYIVNNNLFTLTE